MLFLPRLLKHSLQSRYAIKISIFAINVFSIRDDKIRGVACSMQFVDITLTVWIKTVFKRDDINYFHEPSNFLSSVSSLRYLKTNYSTLKADASCYRQAWVFVETDGRSLNFDRSFCHFAKN